MSVTKNEAEGCTEMVLTIYISSNLTIKVNIYYIVRVVLEISTILRDHNTLSFVGCPLRCHLEGNVLVLNPAATPNSDT
jgi:hypothetical protein